MQLSVTTNAMLEPFVYVTPGLFCHIEIAAYAFCRVSSVK
jgi:hypothetical protein